MVRGKRKPKQSYYVILGNKNSAAQNVEYATKFSFENLHEQVEQIQYFFRKLEPTELKYLYEQYIVQMYILQCYRSFLVMVMVSPVPMGLISINQVIAIGFFSVLFETIFQRN